MPSDWELRDYKKLETIIALRNFEIELFWKRFNHFWLISAAAIVGYVTVKDRSDSVLLLVSCFGFVSSFCWCLLNTSSKWWQEAYELKLKKYEGILDEGIISKHDSADGEIQKVAFFVGPPKRFSVTAVAFAFSCFSAIMWLGLATYHFLALVGFLDEGLLWGRVGYCLAFVGSIASSAMITWFSWRGKPRTSMERFLGLVVVLLLIVVACLIALLPC